MPDYNVDKFIQESYVGQSPLFHLQGKLTRRIPAAACRTGGQQSLLNWRLHPR